MNDVLEKEATCPHCGFRHDAADDVCPSCGGKSELSEMIPNSTLDWARTRDSLKIKWVAAVIAFWVSAAVLGFLMFVDGKINLILTSITLGMLVIGVWLKARYQLHLRKEPGKH